MNKQNSMKEASSPLDVKGSNEESKSGDLATEGLNENNFDVVQSPPVRRGGTLYKPGASDKSKLQAAMVP